MGIRGLSRFFALNPGLSQHHRLHNTTVVFDGNNLINFLYFEYEVPCVYGGDYDRYASVVRNYFSSYLDCNINPIVIFDGGHDRTDRKLKTIIERVHQRIEAVDRIANQESYAEEVLPIFACDVFMDVIKEMNIKHARSSFEADGPIACIANHYQCPVISLDSDFYVFDVRFGFIRSDYVNTTVKTDMNRRGRQYKFLSCRIYYVDNFLSLFPGIEKSILPLFSTLLGNDFVDISTFDAFFQSDEFPRVESKELKIVNERHQRMIGLLEWLKGYCRVDDAIKDVLQYLPVENRKRLRKLIRQAVDVYTTSGLSLVNYLGPASRGCDSFAVNPSEILTTFEGNSLPAWFVDNFHRVSLASFVLNIVGLRRMILPVQVEDTALPSSHACSLNIRRVLYGLLSSLEGVRKKNTPNIYIEEYVRIEKALQKKIIRPTIGLEGFGPLPKLSTMQMNAKDAEFLISCALGEEKAYMNELPDFLQLLAMSIRYWLRTCSPKTFDSFFDALLLTILYLTIAEPRVPECSKTMDQPPTGCRKLPSPISQDALILDIMNRVLPSDATYYWKKIQKYFQPPRHNGRNPIALHIVHSFSQLQGCVFYSQILNEVTGKPFLTPKIGCTFSGSLVYNLTAVLQTQSSPVYLRNLKINFWKTYIEFRRNILHVSPHH